MKTIIKLALAILIVVLLFKQEPVCWFDTKVQVTKATLHDIQDRINGLTTSPLILYHTGSSMYPTIKDGQVCYCDKQTTYQKGDIISFYQLDADNQIEFISHRIYDITPLGFITKGDNNPSIDYVSTPPENVFCKIREESLLSSLVKKVKGTS
jgi:signal peptidase I